MTIHSTDNLKKMILTLICWIYGIPIAIAGTVLAGAKLKSLRYADWPTLEETALFFALGAIPFAFVLVCQAFPVAFYALIAYIGYCGFRKEKREPMAVARRAIME